MTENGIVIVGLGPATAKQLTREAWDWLRDCKEIWARTFYHPVISELQEEILVHGFDRLPLEPDNSNEDKLSIAEKIIELAGQEALITYAVPGSPNIAEESVRQIIELAKVAKIPVKIIDGMSYLEPVCRALGIDPQPKLILTDALYLASMEIPFFPASSPAIVSNLQSGMEATEL